MLADRECIGNFRADGEVGVVEWVECDGADFGGINVAAVVEDALVNAHVDYFATQNAGFGIVVDEAAFEGY